MPAGRLIGEFAGIFPTKRAPRPPELCFLRVAQIGGHYPIQIAGALFQEGGRQLLCFAVRAVCPFCQSAPYIIYRARQYQLFFGTRQSDIQHAYFLFAVFLPYRFGQSPLGKRIGYCPLLRVGKIHADAPFLVENNGTARVHIVKLFSQIGNEHNRKFQPFAFMYRHHAHQIFSFALEFGGRGCRFRYFHFIYIAYEIKQSFPASFFILFCFFQQKPQVCLTKRSAGCYAEIIVIAGFPIKHPQKLRQGKVARGFAPAF